MTLTEKEIKALEIFNKKGLVYEYVEVQAVGLNGVMTTVNKLQKIGAKAKKVNPVQESWKSNDFENLTMAQIEDAQEARRIQARKNNL